MLSQHWSPADLSAQCASCFLIIPMAIPAEVVDEVKKILEGADGEKIVKSVHAALRKLEEHGHFYKMQIHSRHVGCHPQNRDGSGINAIDVHELLDDILGSGFVLDRVNAIAVEVSKDEELTWNKNMVLQMGGQLGTLDESQLKVLSLAGSHTNFVCRIIDQQIPHEGSTVTSEGKLSKELLARHDEAFAEAVQNGYQWRVLSKHVALQLPEILSLVQRMGNTTLNRGEHELQLLRRLHRLWVAESSKGSVDFAKVRKIASQGVPQQLARSIPHLYTFALKAAGGMTPWLLEETETFVRKHTSSTKVLGPDMWNALSVDIKGAYQLLRFRHAMVTWTYVNKSSLTHAWHDMTYLGLYV